VIELKDIVEAALLGSHHVPFVRLSNLFSLSGFLVRLTGLTSLASRQSPLSRTSRVWGPWTHAQWEINQSPFPVRDNEQAWREHERAD
jgi:hypothetical protein